MEYNFYNKKTKQIIFHDNDIINLKNYTSNIAWKNSYIINGINYISPKDNIYQATANYIKNNDNEYKMSIKSILFNKTIQNNLNPVLNINHEISYIDLVFCLRKYHYMFKRLWHGGEDAYNKIKNVSFILNFYVNDNLIGTLKSATRGSTAYNPSTPFSIIIYDNRFTFGTPIFKKEGAKYDFHNTDSVHYYIDLAVDISIFTRNSFNIFNFKTELTIPGYVSSHIINSESFINVNYMYKTETKSSNDGTAIFYEDK